MEIIIIILVVVTIVVIYRVHSDKKKKEQEEVEKKNTQLFVEEFQKIGVQYDSSGIPEIESDIGLKKLKLFMRNSIALNGWSIGKREPRQ